MNTVLNFGNANIVKFFLKLPCISLFYDKEYMFKKSPVPSGR